jgi:hypothetical protein
MNEKLLPIVFCCCLVSLDVRIREAQKTWNEQITEQQTQEWNQLFTVTNNNNSTNSVEELMYSFIYIYD